MHTELLSQYTIALQQEVTQKLTSKQTNTKSTQRRTKVVIEANIAENFYFLKDFSSR